MSTDNTSHSENENTRIYRVLPVWRRNGSLSSCENCRLAKTRCDHNIPCGRCSQLGKECFFHPAPMSRRAAAVGNKKRKLDASTSDQDSHIGMRPAQIRTPLTLHNCGYAGYTRDTTGLPVGYMGSTGHAAIFEENSDVRPAFSSAEHSNKENFTPSTQPVDMDDQAQLGASILAWLPPQLVCERLLNVDLSELGVVVPFRAPRVYHYMNRFWKQYGHRLYLPRDIERLKHIAISLNENTRKQIPIPASNSEFVDSFSGPNSRWELLGEFFLVIGWAVFVMLDNTRLVKEIVPPETDRISYSYCMLECADACLRLCDELAVPSNILAVTLFNRCVQHQANISGEWSYELWKRLGSLVAAVTGLGLHVKASPAESRSALYHELRNRVLTGTFGLDKDIATFMGRPPLLSRHFISTDLPLDVHDDDLWSESDLTILQQQNDADGWNQHGEIYLTTQLRAMAMLRYLRDEILELSLRVSKPVDLDAQIESLRVRIVDCFRGLPAIFRQAINKSSLTGKSAWEVMSITQLQLTHYHNIFLCERIREQDKDGQILLQASKDMLDIVNAFWSERDQYHILRYICYTLISNYGIPAASALAIYLWRQHSGTNTAGTLDRPGVVQNLYLFTAALDWVDRSFGNYGLCQEIKKRLNDVLNHVMSSPETSTSSAYLLSESIWGDHNFSFAGMPNIDMHFDDVDEYFHASPIN